MSMTLAMANLKAAIDLLKSLEQSKERDEVIKKLQDALTEIEEVWRKI